MENPPFRSDLAYAVQNEDYRTELAALARIHRGAPLRVLMVASSGENALSLLTDERVGGVDAVDINPAQLHLCALRCAALEALDRDDQLRLFGASPDHLRASDAAARGALYDRVRVRLPDTTLAYWDGRRDRDLAFGVQHVGRNDVLMHDVQDRLRAAGFAPLARMPEDRELLAWRAVYEGLMTPPYVRELFGLPSEGLAARISGIAGRIGECHLRALQQPDAARNYFVTTALANAYAAAAGDDGVPACLSERGQSVLRRRGVAQRLRLHVGSIFDLAEALAAAHGRFDLISISNIADWMSDDQFAAIVARMQPCLAAGGALLARTATGSRMIADVLARSMRTDDALNAALARVERGPWFRTIGAGFRD
jgi:S-adenosylmethionine:diacylglycerol 3-amino-3-carboxypropyl transferase